MSNNLKSLQVRKSKLQDEINDLEKDKTEILNRIKEKRTQISKIQSSLKQLQARVVITEHAKLRYLERVKGINMADIEQEILSNDLEKQILALGSGKFNRNGFRLIVRNNAIVTVEKDE